MIRDGNNDRVGPVRDRRPLYPTAPHLFLTGVPRLVVALVAVFVLSPIPAVVGQVPEGAQLQVGPAALPGVGIQLGYVAAKNFFTRELNVVADLSAFRSSGNVQTALALGGAVRIFGIWRTIGNTPYGGLDVDLGMRIGPGLLFELRESRAAKNRRFNLFVEPFVRTSARVGDTLVYLELGGQRPHARAGFWISLER